MRKPGAKQGASDRRIRVGIAAVPHRLNERFLDLKGTGRVELVGADGKPSRRNVVKVEEPRTRVRLRRSRGGVHPMALRVEVPNGAKPGKYRIRISQTRGRLGVVGGVTFELQVDKG